MKFAPSVVVVVVKFLDPKSLYTYNYSYSKSSNGYTMTSSSGLAFIHNNSIYVLTDCNIFSCSPLNISYSILVSFSNSSKEYNSKLIYINYFDDVESYLLQSTEPLYIGYPSKTSTLYHKKKRLGFALLKLEDLKINENKICLLDDLMGNSNNINNINSGDNIYSISSPFSILCNSVLNNSIISGNISNIISINDSSVYLLSINMLAGMEGSIVLDKYNNSIGLLLMPLCFIKNRQVLNNITLGICIPMNVIISKINHLLNDTNNIKHSNNIIKSNYVRYNTLKLNNIKCKYNYIVPVMIGSSWGSGIIIHPSGFILSNAHVVREKIANNDYSKLKLHIGLMTRNNIRTWKNASIKFITNKNSINDLVLLKLDGNYNNLPYIKPPTPDIFNSILSNNNIINVSSIGYPLFHPNMNLNPIVTNGIISKLVKYNNKIIIIRSCSNIYSGHSGGILIDNNNNWLGIVTMNSEFDNKYSNYDTHEKVKLYKYNKLNNNKPNKSDMQVFPTINFSIPINIIYPLINYIQSFNFNEKDPKLLNILKELNCENSYITSLWNLENENDRLSNDNYNKKIGYYVKQIPEHLLEKASKL